MAVLRLGRQLPAHGKGNLTLHLQHLAAFAAKQDSRLYHAGDGYAVGHTFLTAHQQGPESLHHPFGVRQTVRNHHIGGLLLRYRLAEYPVQIFQLLLLKNKLHCPHSFFVLRKIYEPLDNFMPLSLFSGAAKAANQKADADDGHGEIRGKQQ